MTSRPSASHWWQACAFLRHRNRVEDVHPLFEGLQEQRGTGWMTVEHVLAVLDAKDPAALVASWIGGEVVSGVPMMRRCQWRGCRKEKIGDGPAARYCEGHAALRKRQADRESKRRGRAIRRTGPDVRKLTAETRVPTAS